VTDAQADRQQHAEQGVHPRVLVFYDYACQFCYLDWPRFKRLRAEHDVELFLVPFELRPELAPEGVPITALGDVHSDRVREHMARMASEGGLELAFPDFVPNTHFAIAASEFARDRGPVIHERVHEAILAAYSGQADDIGNLGVLSEVISEAGLESTSVLSAIAEGRFDERIHQFTHLAMEMGVNATPAALICNELLIGSRPYRVLSEALAKCIVTAADLDTGQASDGG
jgi:predicted DsbA family dithiol-disulfide isomerase